MMRIFALLTLVLAVAALVGLMGYTMGSEPGAIVVHILSLPGIASAIGLGVILVRGQ
jgi:hypothetical protein